MEEFEEQQPMAKFNIDLEQGANYNQYNQQPKTSAKFNVEQYKEMVFEKLGISNATHPLFCFIHIVLKFSAIFSYLFLGIIFSPIMLFIQIIVLQLVDFWVVKNLSGRFLVGMRWSKEIDIKTGEEKWVLENDKEHSVSSIDRTIFWGGLIISSAFWMLVSCLKFISLQPFWLTLGLCSAFLTGTNFYGYYKCRNHSGDNFS